MSGGWRHGDLSGKLFILDIVNDFWDQGSRSGEAYGDV